MAERLGPEFFELEDLLGASRATASLVEQGSLGNILALAGREVIYDSHLARAGKER